MFELCLRQEGTRPSKSQVFGISFRFSKARRFFTVFSISGGMVYRKAAGIQIFREKKFDGKRLRFLVYEEFYSIPNNNYGQESATTRYRFYRFNIKVYKDEIIGIARKVKFPQSCQKARP